MIKVGRKALITSGILIVLSAGGVMTYLSKDNPTEKVSIENTASAHKESTKDKQKAMTDEFLKNASVESVILWKFYYGNEVNGGGGSSTSATSTVASTDRPSIDEQQFISASEKFISAEKLQTALSYIGKPQNELEAANVSKPEGLEVFYNAKNVVEGVTLDITPTTSKQLIKYIGEPVFQLDEEEALLYHGQTYDFIIYRTGEKKFSKLTILHVLDGTEMVENPGAAAEETSEEKDDNESSQQSSGDSVPSSQNTSSKNSSTSSNKSTGKVSTPSPTVPGNTTPTPTPAPAKNNDSSTVPTAPEVVKPQEPTPEPTPQPEPETPVEDNPSEPPAGTDETPPAQ